jgi:transposase
MTILGIDVGKDYIDCELLADKRASRKVPNSVRGFDQLVAWLRNRKVAKVHACMEATGGWSEELAFFLHEHGHVVSIVNPMQIRAFGQSELSRAKTDKADATLIARFCQAMHPMPGSRQNPLKGGCGSSFAGADRWSRCERRKRIVWKLPEWRTCATPFCR